VSLEGTLETIALPDILALLSVTAKTGELRIEAPGGVGSVWFDAGRLAGFDVGNQKTAVDALFALIRLKEGSFKFHAGTEAANPIPPQDVAPVLDEAENRLTEWPTICAAVPSLQSELSLRESVEGAVMLRPEQWQLVATIGGGRRVGEVLNLRELGEFNGCQALKELVDLHLVRVTGEYDEVHERPLSPGPAVPAAQADEAGTPEVAPSLATSEEQNWAHNGAHWGEAGEAAEVADLSKVWDEETVESAPTEQVPAAAQPEPVNRGLLLKFLGSARN